MRAQQTCAIALALAACGDDGGGDGSSATTTAATTGTATASGDSTGSTSASGDSTGSSDGGSGSGPLDASSDGGSTGGGGAQIQLANDGWRDGAAAAFQMGFVMGECWGSTFAPEPEHYPFTVVGATMIVGGEDMGTADFEIGLWEVDATGVPTMQLGSGVATVSGVDDGFDAVALAPLGIASPLVESGSFALSACLVAHDGFPAIARDDDGTIAADRNWIFAEGAWTASSGLGLTGDWILRATIELQ
jgi:hypothetical protein